MELGLYNYIVTIGWMRVVLKLEKSELPIFALIHGFSQTEGNRFRGSLGYIAAWTGLTKATVITAINSLLEKRFINKYEYTKNHIKYCEYEYNRLYVDGLIKTYEEAHESEKSNYSKNLNGSLTIQENIIPHSKNLNTSLKKFEYPIQKTLTNNIDNINSKKEIENKINKRSSNVDVDSAFNSSLKNVIKEEKEIKKATKNKLQAKMLEGSVPLNEITTEKLSDINNDETQQRREARAEAAAERKAMELQAQRNRVMKARLHQAEKFYTDPLILDLLEKFISQYQLRNNFLAEEAWELILEKTLNIPVNILKESIEYSIMQGYKQIFPIRKESIDNTINHVVDKKALREFTPEEEAEYDKNLARNADGSYMEF